MHVTLRMTIMLSKLVLWRKEGGDSRTVAFDGKVENPWLEAKTKHVPELAAFGLSLGSSTAVPRSLLLPGSTATSMGQRGSREHTPTSWEPRTKTMIPPPIHRKTLHPRG